MGNFMDLPEEILELVLKKMSHDEFLQFGGVCRASRSIYLAYRRHLPVKLPMSLCLPRPVGVPLLFLSCKEGSTSVDIISITDEATRTTASFPRRLKKWYCGSCCGWLVAVDIVGHKSLHLLNPFTNAHIKLPPLSSFQLTYNNSGQLDCISNYDFRYVEKVILSITPERSPKDCKLMAIVGNNKILSFCKLGDDKWINVHGSPYRVVDVVYHEGNFVVVTYAGVTLSCEDDGNKNYNVRIIAEPPINITYQRTELRRYLVTSRGRLLHIERMLHFQRKVHGRGHHGETIGFNVFELSKRILPASFYAYCNTTKGHLKELNAEYQWVEVKNIGDEMLFLGLNCSISLPAKFYPNCTGNSIYFTDDDIDNNLMNFRERNDAPAPDIRYDLGVYNMENKTVRRYNLEANTEVIPPIWVMPNPWR